MAPTRLNNAIVVPCSKAYCFNLWSRTVGAAASIGNIVIHALVMAEIVWAVQIVRARTAWKPSLLLVVIMIVTVSILMAAHASDVAVWALV